MSSNHMESAYVSVLGDWFSIVVEAPEKRLRGSRREKVFLHEPRTAAPGRGTAVAAEAQQRRMCGGIALEQTSRGALRWDGDSNTAAAEPDRWTGAA